MRIIAGRTFLKAASYSSKSWAGEGWLWLGTWRKQNQQGDGTGALDWSPKGKLASCSHGAQGWQGQWRKLGMCEDERTQMMTNFQMIIWIWLLSVQLPDKNLCSTGYLLYQSYKVSALPVLCVLDCPTASCSLYSGIPITHHLWHARMSSDVTKCSLWVQINLTRTALQVPSVLSFPSYRMAVIPSCLHSRPYSVLLSVLYWRDGEGCFTLEGLWLCQEMDPRLWFFC